MTMEINSSNRAFALAESLHKARMEKASAGRQGQTEATVSMQDAVQKTSVSQQHAEQYKKAAVEMEREDVTRHVESMNKSAQNLNRTLNFSVEENTGNIIVRVIDPETKEVIRQIPADEVKRVSERMQEDNLTGVLLRAEV